MTKENYRERVYMPSMRLCLLRVLHASPAEEANSAVLQNELRRWKFETRREVVHQQLGVLEQLGAITTERLSVDVMSGKLTADGRRHLTRAQLIEGIEEPED